MHIREFQTWLQTWDQARGWDQVAASHTLVHALEEMGEVARAMLRREGYKSSSNAAEWRAELREELSDVFFFLFKLAYQCNIDVEDALLAGMAKAEARFPVETGEPELKRYLERQAEINNVEKPETNL